MLFVVVNLDDTLTKVILDLSVVSILMLLASTPLAHHKLSTSFPKGATLNFFRSIVVWLF